MVYILWKSKARRSKLFELGNGCLTKKVEIASYSLLYALLQTMQRLIAFAPTLSPTDIFLQLGVGLLQSYVLTQ